MAQVVDDDSDMVVYLALLLRWERGAEVRLHTAAPLRSRTCEDGPMGGRDRVITVTKLSLFLRPDPCQALPRAAASNLRVSLCPGIPRSVHCSVLSDKYP